jgi:hypothetical protein
LSVATERINPDDRNVQDTLAHHVLALSFMLAFEVIEVTMLAHDNPQPARFHFVVVAHVHIYHFLLRC